MNRTALQAAIETELSHVQDRLTSSVGTASMCTLEKSGEMTRSIKYLEGQQQGFHKALKHLRANGDEDTVLSFLAEEKLNNEKMLRSPVGQSGHWQEYLQGSLDALERIQEMMGL